MPLEMKMFVGIGAYVAMVDGPRSMKFVANTYQGEAIKLTDSARHIPLDLSATPKTIGQTDWSKVTCDDRGENYNGDPLAVPPAGGVADGVLVTTVDPFDPKHPLWLGAVYLEYDHFINNLKAIAVPANDPSAKWPLDGFEEYELVTLAYREAANPIGAHSITRYVGFKATVLDRVDMPVSGGQRTLLRITVKWPGKVSESGPFWIDTSNRDECDFSPAKPADKYTLVKDKSDTGAVFLNMRLVSQLHAGNKGLRGPKLPPNLG